MMALSDLGQRICIIGLSSSGKSTLANALSRKLKIPLCHLDSIAHEPGTKWERRPVEDFVADHDKFIAQDAWVVEGNYSTCMPQRFERATSVIFTDLSRFGFLYRYLKRCFFEDQSKRVGTLQNAKQEFTLNLIYMNLKHYKQRKNRYNALLQAYKHLKILHLTSFSDVKALYKKWDLQR